MSLFGTDGIRGKAGEGPLSQENVYRLGMAIGYLLKEQSHSFHSELPDWFTKIHRIHSRNIIGKGRVLIGRDTRPSGPDIERQLVEGLGTFGVSTLSAGVIPTPGISYLTRKWGCALGVVISASHNPAQDNGIKLF